MTDHDPLCPHVALDAYFACLCGTIAKARADERERIIAVLHAARLHYAEEFVGRGSG